MRASQISKTRRERQRKTETPASHIRKSKNKHIPYSILILLSICVCVPRGVHFKRIQRRATRKGKREDTSLAFPVIDTRTRFLSLIWCLRCNLHHLSQYYEETQDTSALLSMVNKCYLFLSIGDMLVFT